MKGKAANTLYSYFFGSTKSKFSKNFESGATLDLFHPEGSSDDEESTGLISSASSIFSKTSSK